ncbi:MAG: glycerophosphodiester phosphodiesterase [Flavobacteriales bacterium]|nr:glycerophosphodiester phosphodiesterase [Flavobacteriales bacterium]
MRQLLLLMVLSTQVFGQNVLVTAHRGASGYAPENTLSAVKKALEIGVDRIEVDVQQSSDGVVVVMHDKTLDRTTDSKGKVGKKTWEELKQVKAYGKFPSEFPNEPIPTLEQVFELMDGKTQFVIEIKAGNKTYPGIEDNVVKLIKKYKAEKWALVHSFNDKVLKYLHRNYPEIRLQKLFVSYSAGVMLDFKLHSVKLSKYDYVEGFGIAKSAAKEKLVKKIHDLGKVVHVWTVNSEEDIQAMIDLGVDGIIGNYPDRTKKLLGRN